MWAIVLLLAGTRKRTFDRTEFVALLNEACQELNATEKDVADALHISNSRLSQIKSVRKEVRP